MATINALGMPDPISVPFGGLGSSSYTAGSTLIGQGTSPVTGISATLNGQTIIAATSGTPSYQQLTAGTGITINNTANNITINATGGGGSGTVQSWTPVVTWQTGGTPGTYTASGSYVQLGTLVAFQGTITFSSTGTVGGSNIVVISGLPTNGLLSGENYNATIYNTSGTDSSIIYIAASMTLSSGIVQVRPVYQNVVYYPPADVTSTTIINITGYYFVT